MVDIMWFVGAFAGFLWLNAWLEKMYRLQAALFTVQLAWLTELAKQNGGELPAVLSQVEIPQAFYDAFKEQ